MDDGLITISIMTKNNKEDLIRCLSSFVAFNLPILIIDTGSQDGTIEYLRENKIQYIEKEFNDDFSEIRNLSFDFIKTKWIFFIDSDEYIEEEKLKEILKKLKTEKSDIILFPVNNLVNENVIIREPFKIKIIKNISSLRYKGKIHEYIDSGIENTCVFWNIPIIHTGYQNQEVNFDKIKRNLKILEKELEIDPENPFLIYYKYREQFNYQEFSTNDLKNLEYIITQKKYINNILIRNLLLDMYLTSLLKQKNYSKIFTTIESFKKEENIISIHILEVYSLAISMNATEQRRKLFKEIENASRFIKFNTDVYGRDEKILDNLIIVNLEKENEYEKIKEVQNSNINTKK